MAKTSKATKKFNKKHLKNVLERRNKAKVYKQKMGERKSSKGGHKSINGLPKVKENKVFDDMDLDKFFDKKTEVPKEKKTKKKSDKSSSSSDEDGDEDMEMDQKDLDDLKKDDPEFYKYLQQNDKDLLEFKPMNPLDAISDSDEDEDEQEEEDGEEHEEKSKKDSLPTIEVSVEMVKRWKSNLKSDKPTIKGIKHVVIAFKSAVNSQTDREYRYKVTDGKIFNLLTILVLRSLPLALEKLVPYKKSSNGVRYLPTGNKKKVAQVSSIVKIHAGSLLELLDGITNTETAALILQSVQELFPYFTSWRKLVKRFIEMAANVWSQAKEFDTQVAAFAFLNNVTREYPKSLLEITLNSLYSSFIKNCRRTNIHTKASINFQKNSMSGLFGIDANTGYQIGFENIRQLAIHLRGSVNNPTKDSYKTVYNWQVCHALDFWSRMLSSQCSSDDEKSNQNPLKQLVYPLVQVTLGTIRLVPSAQFFPLRFYLIRSLIRLSRATGYFIPLFPLLSEVLTSASFNKRPRNITLAAVDFENSIKVSQSYLGSRIYQEGVSEQFIDVASEFFVLYCKNIAFPELVTPAVIYLRRYRKTGGNPKFDKMLSTLIAKLNANAKFIEEKRSNVEYGPSNRQEVSKFLQDLDWDKTPLGAYVKTEREVKAAREKLLRESMEKAEQEEKERKEKEEALVAEEHEKEAKDEEEEEKKEAGDEMDED